MTNQQSNHTTQTAAGNYNAQAIGPGAMAGVTVYQSPAPAALPSSSLSPVDILLVTVTDVETRAVITLLQEKYNRKPTPCYLGPKTYYDLGLIGGACTYIVRSEMGAGGPGGSTVTVSEAIEKLAPSAIIMVGIAFGLNPKEQAIGDVLVSRQLHEYDLQRVGTDPQGRPAIIPRGDRVTASPRLLDRFRDGVLTWQEKAKIKFGLLLSGQKLIDSLDLRDQLRALEPEAIGGEMEGAGVYDSAQFHKVDWLIVKAICDWADGHKRKNKSQRQQQAAQNAAQFVIHVLERGGLAREKTSLTQQPPVQSDLHQVPYPVLEPAQMRQMVCGIYDETEYIEQNLQSADFVSTAHLNALHSIIKQISDSNLPAQLAPRHSLRVNEAASQVVQGVDKIRDVLIRSGSTNYLPHDLKTQLGLLSISLGELRDLLLSGSDCAEL